QLGLHRCKRHIHIGTHDSHAAGGSVERRIELIGEEVQSIIDGSPVQIGVDGLDVGDPKQSGGSVSVYLLNGFFGIAGDMKTVGKNPGVKSAGGANRAGAYAGIVHNRSTESEVATRCNVLN